MSGGIVFTAAMSHVPFITGLPAVAPANARERLYAALRDAGARLRAARPDVVVVVTSDHFNNFFSDCYPPFCVGVAERYEGPVERWLNVEPMAVSGHPGFASEILNAAADAPIDIAITKGLRLEHGVVVPLSFVLPGFDLPILPLVQNCMVPPLPSTRRCFALGRLIRETAERSRMRVAVIGTGGLSHSPGAPEAGWIDEAFDRRFLKLLSSPKPLDALQLSDEEIDAAGFGTWEVRQWFTALGAAGGARGELLAYEPIREWETGCAVMIF